MKVGRPAHSARNMLSVTALDIPVAGVVRMGTTFPLFVSGEFPQALVSGMGAQPRRPPGAQVANSAAFPIFEAVMGAFGVVTLPLGNAFSRWRERKADRYALESTHKPEAFINAMTRLANQNLSEVDPEPWVEWLLYSHPATRKRIAMAKRNLGS